jgi:hypothetical protein
VAFCEEGQEKKYGSVVPLMVYRVALSDGNQVSACCKKLVQRVDDGSCDFVTDEGRGFFRLLPEERHFYGKDLTFPIEGSKVTFVTDSLNSPGKQKQPQDQKKWCIKVICSHTSCKTKRHYAK